MTVRWWLYRLARLMGDVSAASKGPAPYMKRRVRAKTIGRLSGVVNRALR